MKYPSNQYSIFLKFSYIVILIVILNICSFATAQKNVNLLEQIQGDWTCIDKYTRATGTEDVYYEDGLIHQYCTENIRIQKNQVSFFDLPCEFQFAATLANVNNELSYKSSDENHIQINNYVSLKHDTLIISSGGMWSVTSYYIRDTFENKVISQLLKDLINPACLYGTWCLTKEYNSGYDGWGSMPYKFPFEVLDTLTIDEKNINNYWIGQRKILLPTGDKFLVTRLSSKSRVLKLKAAFKHNIIKDNWEDGYLGNSEPEYFRCWDDE